MDALLITVDRVLRAVPLFAVVFLLAFGARWLLRRTTSYCIDEELTERDNPAFGIAFAGYMLGVAIALSGALYPWEGHTMLEEIASIMLFGVLAAALMRLSLWINDRAILHSFPIEKELVQDHNAGTGFVVAGSSIATGFMLRGVLTGFSSSLWTGLRDVAIYFIVGQIILVAGGWVYTRFAGYDVHHEIGENDNMAAGISFGGYLAALGYIASVALTGASSEWMDEIVTSLVLAFFGVLLLITVRVIADVFLLPKSPLAKEVAVDRNTAAGAVAAVSFLLVAVLFAASIQPDPSQSAPTAALEESSGGEAAQTSNPPTPAGVESETGEGGPRPAAGGSQ